MVDTGFDDMTKALGSRTTRRLTLGALLGGALADIGSHVAYLVEFLGGDVQEVSGGRFTTAITERPVPLGTVVGHGHAAVSDTFEAVENDDYASFSAQFERERRRRAGPRVEAGHPNGLALEVFGDAGAANGSRSVPRSSSSC